jgi:hypothetical protein
VSVDEEEPLDINEFLREAGLEEDMRKQKKLE